MLASQIKGLIKGGSQREEALNNGGASEKKLKKNKSSLVSAAANETFPCMHTTEHVHKDLDVVNTEGGGGWGGQVWSKTQ